MNPDRPEGGPRPPRSALLALYLLVAALAGPFAGPVARRRVRQGREDPSRWPERLGRTTMARPAGPLAWFHAASVGESLSVVTLIRRLAEARPDLSILVTTNTVTSATLLANRLPERAVHQFLPYDFGPGVPGFLAHWRPDAAFWVESEFWPRLMVETHARGIPMTLVNARVSDRSARNWARLAGLARALLGRFGRLLAPDAETAARLVALGAGEGRIRVTGSLKEGEALLPFDPDDRERLAALIARRPVWLAASTHPGEEEAVAAAHALAAAAIPDLLTIIAPRHPERGGAIAEMLGAAGLGVAVRSRGEAPGPATDVYLADTIGEMGLWFDLAPVAFMGGSLVPVGGHNPHEPAAHGAAILHGPHTGNFRAIYAKLDARGGAIAVASAEDMADALLVLQDSEGRAAIAENARRVAEAGGSALAAVLEEILARLPRSSGPAAT